MSTTSSLSERIICESVCKTTNNCNSEGIYWVLALLIFLSLALGVTTFIFYRLYKKEQKSRLTGWKVKSRDISLEQAPLIPNVTSEPYLNLFDEKAIQETKRAKQYYTTTGTYKGRLVAVQKFRTRRLSLETRKVMKDLDQIFTLDHEHVCKFYGANQDGGFITVLNEYCTRGSLKDLLKEQSDWDDIFKNSLMFDIIKGMLYLHQTFIDFHGNLKPSNCLIDSRFMVKITDFGIIGLQSKIREKEEKNKEKLCLGLHLDKLYTAPEFLRISNSSKQRGSKKGDVYSFAIIAQEILFQKGAFYRKDESYTPKEIIDKITSSDSKEIFRPTLKDDDDVVISEQWRSTLQKCWAEEPKERMPFKDIFEVAKRLQTENTLIDSLLQRLQKYSDFLEEKVEEKTEQYKAEKERSDSLLYQMLPKSVANRLKVNTDVMPESYEQVTVYFSDIVGFSAICHESQPLEVVQMLNDLYIMFDQIVDEFDVYKVETIGDAYMVVSGLPIRNGDNHAREIARMALRLRHSVCNEFEIRHMPNVQMKLRVGIHTGPVVAGVVGLKMPRYCLFGDTVNTAARMEQNGKELKIHISPHTKEILDKFGTFDIEKRKQSVAMKGIGEWNTWWLNGEKGFDESVSHPVFRKTSQSSDIGVLSDNRRLSDSSTDENDDLAAGEFKSKRISNSMPLNRKGSQPQMPARYRPSRNANPSKQRRVGSAHTPLLVTSQNHTHVANDHKANRTRRMSLHRRVSLVNGFK